MNELSLNTSTSRQTLIFVERDRSGSKSWGNFVSTLPESALLVVTTPTVDHLYGDVLRQKLAECNKDFTWHVTRAKENSKNIESTLEICKLAQRNHIRRDGAIIAFGGGVCNDISTLAASLIRRGISLHKIPTTLIAQIDAAVGLRVELTLSKPRTTSGATTHHNQFLCNPTFFRR